MSYVGICFFNEVGRCLCGPVASGGGNLLAGNQTNVMSVGDLRVSLPGGSMNLTAPLSMSAPGGGSGKSVTQIASRPSSGDSVLDRSGANQRLGQPGGSTSTPVTLSASASAGGEDETASQTAASWSSGDSLFGHGAATGASQGWSGGGASGGAPAPELNAGLGLLLAGITVVYLRRRRVRRFAQAAWTTRPDA